MAGVHVSVKYAKETKDLEFADASATIGDLRDAIEKQLSVPKAVQTLICSGRRWQGVAFGDDLTLIDAAGPKGAKDLMGTKAISVMLMAPADASGEAVIERCQASVEEVWALLGAPPPAEPTAHRQALLLADDLLTRAATDLDSASLVGAMRERRRELLKQIEALGEEVATRKASLSGK